MKINKYHIKDLLNDPYWIIFSVQNPVRTKMSAVANDHAHRVLITTLSLGLHKFAETKGHYAGKSELGVFLKTNQYKRIVARAIAIAYRQESVLTHEGLVYQDGSCHPATGITIHPSRPSGDYTEINGIYFSVDIDFSKKI